MMRMVLCLDTGTECYFADCSPREALEKMQYTLDLVKEDKAAKIYETKSGKCLFLEHSGLTFGTVIR